MVVKRHVDTYFLLVDGAPTMATSDTVRTRLEPFRPPSVWVGLTALVMAVIVGIAVFAVVFPVMEAGWVWLLATAAAFVYLSQQAVPSEVAGVSFYILAICAVAFPLTAGASMMASEGGELGGLFTIIVVGFIGVLVGIVLAGVGYLFNRRASKIVNADTPTEQSA